MDGWMSEWDGCSCTAQVDGSVNAKIYVCVCMYACLYVCMVSTKQKTTGQFHICMISVPVCAMLVHCAGNQIYTITHCMYVCMYRELK